MSFSWQHVLKCSACSRVDKKWRPSFVAFIEVGRVLSDFGAIADEVCPQRTRFSGNKYERPCEYERRVRPLEDYISSSCCI